jgi:hypothetical protein
MKRLTLAAILACAGTAFAQYTSPSAPPQIEAPKQREVAKPAVASAAPAVNLPKSNCEPKPQYPAGAAQYVLENRKKVFERDFENYKKCMMAYIDERKAMHEANAALHKAAVDEFNATMKAVTDAQQSGR